MFFFSSSFSFDGNHDVVPQRSPISVFAALPKARERLRRSVNILAIRTKHSLRPGCLITGPEKATEKSKASIGNRLMEALSARNDEAKWTRFRRKAATFSVSRMINAYFGRIIFLSSKTLKFFER